MNSLPALPINYLVKSVLKLQPEEAEFFFAVSMLAWLVKPIWGYISDAFPVRGYRRKSYLIGMSLTAACSWFLLAWSASYGNYRYGMLLMFFNVSAIAYAFIDVVCDGLMVEAGRKNRFIDQFVNIQWIGVGLAGVVVGLLSGHLSHIANTRMDFYPVIFAVAGTVPLLTGLVVLFSITEEPVRTPFPWRKFFILVGVLACILGGAALLTPWFLKLSVGARILFVCGGFAVTMGAVWWWTNQPPLFWAMNLFIFCWGFSPSVGQPHFYYTIDVLHFSEHFYGVLRSIDSICGVIGFALYAFIIVRFPHISRRHYLYFSIFLSAIGLGVQYLYYLAPGSTIMGMPLNYYAVAVVSGVFFSVLGAPGILIPLAVAGDAAKSGKEAVTYAWFMSASNFARITLSGLVGAWLYRTLKSTDLSSLQAFIGTADFLGQAANKALILRLFVWISTFFTLLALPVVYFVPLPERNKKAVDS